MSAGTMEQTIHTLLVHKGTDIKAPVEVTFDAVLAELGPGFVTPEGASLSMKIEAWPGGRWFRDLGDNVGHLWGHVQVIKPPTLIEICGPMFMSYPAVNFIQYRLTPDENGTHLTILHRGFGQIPQEHREGVVVGWEHSLSLIREIAERMAR